MWPGKCLFFHYILKKMTIHDQHILITSRYLYWLWNKTHLNSSLIFINTYIIRQLQKNNNKLIYKLYRKKWLQKYFLRWLYFFKELFSFLFHVIGLLLYFFLYIKFKYEFYCRILLFLHIYIFCLIVYFISTSSNHVILLSIDIYFLFMF